VRRVGLFNLFGDNKKDDTAEDLAILDFLLDDEKEIADKEDYDQFDFDDEMEDEDDYYDEDE
jgi:hypothetical protein